MTLQELYEYTKSQLIELEQEMPFSYGNWMTALFLARLAQNLMVITEKYGCRVNEKMEILAIPSDSDRNNGSTP